MTLRKWATITLFLHASKPTPNSSEKTAGSLKTGSSRMPNSSNRYWRTCWLLPKKLNRKPNQFWSSDRNSLWFQRQRSQSSVRTSVGWFLNKSSKQLQTSTPLSNNSSPSISTNWCSRSLRIKIPMLSCKSRRPSYSLTSRLSSVRRTVRKLKPWRHSLLGLVQSAVSSSRISQWSIWVQKEWSLWLTLTTLKHLI